MTTPNPLPCGCGILGTPRLEGYGSDYTLIQHYDNLHIKFCPLHGAAPALLEALREIAKGKGAYDLDPLIHCANTVESMRSIARAAIAQATGRKP